MKVIIRREVLNYLKRPLFWLVLAAVIFGVFQQLKPYLTIHYLAAGEEIRSDYPDTVHEGEIYEGYIPSKEKEHRALWEEAIREGLCDRLGMSGEEAAGVIQNMSGMEIEKACRYLEEQAGYYGAEYIWEDTAYRKGTAEEINAYIESRLAEHPFSWYFSRKFADFCGLFMGFAATVLLALLFRQDMRKNTYELLHTKPVSAVQYVVGKTAGGFLICLILLGVLNLVFWAACLIWTNGNGFEIRPADFLVSTVLYILPNMLMIVCVYTITALLFKNPLPAVPVLILYMIYSNMGGRNAEGIYGYYGRPLAAMVRFPGNFFTVAPPPMALVNQLCLLFASAAVILIGIQLWRRRRV